MILALDIDGVLNSGKDYEYILECMEIGSDYTDKIKVFPQSKGLFDFVNIESLNKLQTLLNKHPHVQVLGISSWFITKDIDKIGEFLGIQFIGKSDCCGGGLGRAQALMKYGEHVVVLDDQLEGYRECGVKHVRPTQGLTSEITEQLENFIK